jgi:cytoskeletal protein CcmA (bactofilin family)
MSDMADHYDEMTLLLYLEGQLESERARNISAHTGSCPACSALLRSLQHEGLWLRESLTASDEAIPARLLEAPSAGVPWGWVMSLGMGAAGVYGLWSGVVEPWQQRFEQAGFTQGNLLSMLFFSGALWKGWGEMRNLVEILATGVVMVIVAMLLRHNWRRWTTVGVVMGALVFALAIPPAAMAGQFCKGEPNYTLPAGQTINTDAFVAADTTRIDGDVNGDLFAAGHTVIVNGHVTGDVFGFSQVLQINGRVDGNIRGWSQSISIAGSVGKNVLAGADSLDIDPKGSVGGSATVFAGDVNLNGPVGRDVMTYGKNFSVDNKIGGNLQVSAHNISIDSGASIAGGMTYKGDQSPKIDPGAKISGALKPIFAEHIPNYKKPRYYWHLVLSWAASFLFGLALILAIPAFFTDVLRALDRVGMSGGMGFLAVAGVPFAAIIACITIVGLPVGITTVLLYIVGLYSAHVFVGAWIGRKILGEGSGSGALLGRLALGLAILSAVKLVPWLGSIVVAIVVLWGSGAIAVTVYRRLRPVLATA